MERKYIIILPAYNEEKYIAAVLASLTSHEVVRDMDVAVIDDGSTDKTRSIVRGYDVVLVKNGRNRGLGYTFRRAVEYTLSSGYDGMIFFDADGQFSVSDIPRLAHRMNDDAADFVLGSRFIQGTPKNMPDMKVFGNKVLAWFIGRITKTTLTDVACGFRGYSREALLHINTVGAFTYTQEVILDLLFKKLTVIEVPISVTYFSDRESTISSNLWKYGWRVLSIIARTIRDFRPLLFFGTAGIIMFLIGLILDIWMMVYFFQNGMFSPYKIVGFGGAFLNFLGIMIWLIGLVADMLNRQRRIQDELLYIQKKQQYS